MIQHQQLDNDGDTQGLLGRAGRDFWEKQPGIFGKNRQGLLGRTARDCWEEQPRIVGNNTLWKEQEVAGEGDTMFRWGLAKGWTR